MQLLAARGVAVLKYSEGTGRHKLGQQQWAMTAADAIVCRIRWWRRRHDRALYGGGSASSRL